MASRARVRSGHGCREGSPVPERECESVFCPVCPGHNVQHETRPNRWCEAMKGFRAASALVLALVVGLLAVAGHAQEDTAAVSFSISDDSRVQIDVPSAADLYHVLYYRSDPDDAATEKAVALHMGAADSVTLSEPLRIGRTGAYRVATFRRNAPGDIDGDETDDLTELARADKNKRAPFNRRAPFDMSDGAVAIPDLALFQELSWSGSNDLLSQYDPHLQDLEFIRFVIIDLAGEQPDMFFGNTNTHLWHFDLLEAVLGTREAAEDARRNQHVLRGDIVYHPHIRGRTATWACSASISSRATPTRSSWSRRPTRRSP